jgi:hypothetical protein
MHVVPPYHWSQRLNSKIRTTNTELASHSPATLAQELGVPSGLAEDLTPESSLIFAHFNEKY